MASDAPVKVVHIITRMVRGGAQRIVLTLLAGLRRAGFDVLLAAGEQTGPEGSLWDEVEALGIPVVRVPALVREIAPLRDLRALARLREVLRANRPDIVHAHTSKAGFIGCLAARKERVPAVVLAPHGHILAEGARIPGVPHRGITRWLLAKAARRNARYADLVVTPNDHERNDGIGHGVWSAQSSIVVPNGIDMELFRPRDRDRARAALGAAREGFLVGAVARLTSEKGIDSAIKVLAHVREVSLVVVGDGPERRQLALLAASLGVADRVTFAGLRTRVEELMPAFDACLVPSRTEAHGMVAAEALACAVPVIASDVGGLRSIVLPGRTGLMVAAGDVEGYAAAVRLLARDRTLCARLGQAGREHVRARFSNEVMLARTMDVYASILRQKGRQLHGAYARDLSGEPGRVLATSRQ